MSKESHVWYKVKILNKLKIFVSILVMSTMFSSFYPIDMFFYCRISLVLGHYIHFWYMYQIYIHLYIYIKYIFDTFLIQFEETVHPKYFLCPRRFVHTCANLSKVQKGMVYTVHQTRTPGGGQEENQTPFTCTICCSLLRLFFLKHKLTTVFKCGP